MNLSIATAPQNQDLSETLINLKEAHNNYAELYDFSPVAYFTLESNGLIIQTNPIGADLLGLKTNTIINKNFSRYVAADSQYTLSEFLARINSKETIQHCELKLLRKNGPLAHAQLEGKVLLNSKTNNKKLLIAISPYNLRKNTNVENLDPVNYTNELAAIIADELNHPHAIISNYIQGTISQLEKGDHNTAKLLYAMKQAAQQLDRAGEIILRMKNYTCKGILNQEPTCLNSIIKESLTLIKDKANEFPVNVRYTPIRQPIVVHADKLLAQQVILNLARNSIDAMRDSCTINPQLTIEANQINKSFVEILIHDTGPGISPEMFSKLFYPHFTTKPYSSGLGLAISRAIIQSHGGELSTNTSTSNGCCFKFTLPVELSCSNN